VLIQDRLLGNLRQFCDPAYGAFRGFPATRLIARQEWAHAFADYAGVIEEVVPRPPPPADTHPGLGTTGIEAAFFADLGLEWQSAADAAADFAGAWRRGILAVTPGPVTDSAASVWMVSGFTNVAAQHDTLRAALEALFAAPSSSTVPRLTEIAHAFHQATRGLIAAVVVVSSSSVTLPITTMNVR
jgi:hypothetical protein